MVLFGVRLAAPPPSNLPKASRYKLQIDDVIDLPCTDQSTLSDCHRVLANSHKLAWHVTLARRRRLLDFHYF